jgi:hypothetical protein
MLSNRHSTVREASVRLGKMSALVDAAHAPAVTDIITALRMAFSG